MDKDELMHNFFFFFGTDQQKEMKEAREKHEETKSRSGLRIKTGRGIDGSNQTNAPCTVLDLPSPSSEEEILAALKETTPLMTPKLGKGDIYIYTILDFSKISSQQNVSKISFCFFRRATREMEQRTIHKDCRCGEIREQNESPEVKLFSNILYSR